MPLVRGQDGGEPVTRKFDTTLTAKTGKAGLFHGAGRNDPQAILIHRTSMAGHAFTIHNGAMTGTLTR